ncbi:MAG: hypothetical protein RLZZ210_506 [Pseudomonadota bacterium]|jgi:hypothetical protein
MFNARQIIKSTSDYISQLTRSISSSSLSGYSGDESSSSLSKSRPRYNSTHRQVSYKVRSKNYKPYNFDNQSSLFSSDKPLASKPTLPTEKYHKRTQDGRELLPSQVKYQKELKYKIPRRNDIKSDRSLLSNNLNILFEGKKHQEIRSGLSKVASNIKEHSYTDEYGLHRQTNNAPCTYLSHLNGIEFKNKNTLTDLTQTLLKFQQRINISEPLICIDESTACLEQIKDIIAHNQQLFGGNSSLENSILMIQSMLDFIRHNAGIIDSTQVQSYVNNIESLRNKISNLNIKTTPYDLINSIAEQTHTHYKNGEEHMYDEAINLGNSYCKNGYSDGNTSPFCISFKQLHHYSDNPFFNMGYHDKELYKAQIDFLKHIFSNIKLSQKDLYIACYRYFASNNDYANQLFYTTYSRKPNNTEELNTYISKTTNHMMEFINSFKQNGLILNNPTLKDENNNDISTGHNQGIFYDAKTKQVVMVNSAIDYNKDDSLHSRIHTGNLYTTREVNAMLDNVVKSGNYCILSIHQGKGSLPVYSLKTANFLRNQIKYSPNNNYYKERLEFLRGQVDYTYKPSPDIEYQNISSIK